MIGRVMGFSQFGNWDGIGSDKISKVAIFTRGQRDLTRSYQRNDKTVNTWTDAYRTVKSFYSDRKVPSIEFIYD